MHKQVVEYAGVPVGVLVPRGDALTFLAVKFHVMDLDGQRFSSLADTRNAIHALVAQGRVLAA